MSPYYWYLVFLPKREKPKLGKGFLTLASGKSELTHVRGGRTALQLLVNFIRVGAECPATDFPLCGLGSACEKSRERE